MTNDLQQPAEPIEHLDQLAHLLYDDRRQAELEGDGNCPQAFEPGRNPDAKTLYMLGMRDLINCMRCWAADDLEPEVTAAMLEHIYQATSVPATAH